MFAVLNQDEVNDMFPLISNKYQPILFCYPCRFFPVKRSWQPAANMQGICLEAFDLFCKFKNDFWISSDLAEVRKKRICAPDDTRHQEHSRSRSSTEDISFTLPLWISSSDLRMSCIVAGLLRISTVSARASRSSRRTISTRIFSPLYGPLQWWHRSSWMCLDHRHYKYWEHCARIGLLI